MVWLFLGAMALGAATLGSATVVLFRGNGGWGAVSPVSQESPDIMVEALVFLVCGAMLAVPFGLGILGVDALGRRLVR